MAELLLEHFFFRIEIVAEEIDRLIRFAKRFPLGHVAWKVRYRNHPMRPFLKYFNFGRKLPAIDVESNTVANEGAPVPGKRRRSEDADDIPFAAVKRSAYDHPALDELDDFKDALDS